ncbi:MAG: MBL fold metallo-hydrolase [Streptosporangiales bacterium]|nr:MBL fold metallo-hydrolase [Streptosporangiales bacterium]
MADIVPIDTPTLGDRSYLIAEDGVAIVVDPQRDIDRVLALVEARDLRVTHVLETHLHNDYVSGGLELTRRTGATYVVSGEDDVAFERHEVFDGQTVDLLSDLAVRAVKTPGHTFTHLSYVLERAGRPVAAFTGGSLLYGSTGRTDLLGAEHAAALAHAQHRSARRLADLLPPEAEIYPTHGFGSFCAATQVSSTTSTIGAEARTNPALILAENDYVDQLLAGLDAYPAYYARMAPTNAAGPAPVDLSPPARADAGELRRRLDAGEWVVDLRSRRAFARGHVPRTLNFGLDGSAATYLGWLLPWGAPLTLLAESPEQIAETQRELVRIGIDRPAAAAVGTPADWVGPEGTASLRVAGFADLCAELRRRAPEIVVLDTRLNGEWRRSHLRGARHIPLHELPARLAEVPPGEVWVHCASGYRAATAASLLARSGRDVVLVDDNYDENATATGLTAPN